jgi:hypothetical protein
MYVGSLWDCLLGVLLWMNPLYSTKVAMVYNVDALWYNYYDQYMRIYKDNARYHNKLMHVPTIG